MTDQLDLYGPPDPLASVAPLVWRIQHDGRHEQDRWDAMAWLELFAPNGYRRCTCKKCAKLWARSELVDAGSALGRAVILAMESGT